MKVVFLCGGVGKRMYPITEDKFLLDFVGKTLLQHQIDIAQKAGFKQFIIIGNPANMERIEQISKMTSGIEVELALQKQARGVADALRSAEALLDGETIVINPNDILTASAYTSLLRESHDKAATSYLLGYEVTDYFPGGYLIVNSANELERIVEKPKPGEEPSNLVNILLHLHTDTKKLLEYIKKAKSGRDDIYECALDNLAKDGHKIKVVPYNDFWTPIKYPWHIFDAVKYFLDITPPQVSASASISSKATIEGKVIISDKVKVLENAVIRGPVYIGPNSIIGTNALVRDYTHIGADCVIGYSTEIKGSYIGDSCWFHSSYIGDSVIGRNCSFGAGTVLANFRSDEQKISAKVANRAIDTGRDKFGAIIGDDCKTGVNVSIMPGVKIGPHSIVGAHVCLMKDLGPDKIVFAKPRYEILPNTVKFDEMKRKVLKEKLDRIS